jgi:DNA-binding response OmpR family regulator
MEKFVREKRLFGPSIQSTYQVKIDDDRLDAMVERTRRKIEDNPRSPRFLITLNRQGHRLRGLMVEGI